MIVMQRIIVLVVAAALAGCGGGSGPPPGAIGDSADLSRYAVSEPLTDNSSASEYRILIMGNSHAAALQPVLADLLALGQSGKPVDVQLSSSASFLDARVNDGFSEQRLESQPWTHVILQGQKYSTTGANTYPTDAAEYWVRGSKLQGATPIMFPEHPREGNTWEGQTLWELHQGIALRENTCVAPIGLVWDEVVFRAPLVELHESDGNHANGTGALLTALVFYPIITGQPVESLPQLSSFAIDVATETTMREVASELLFVHQPCDFDD